MPRYLLAALLLTALLALVSACSDDDDGGDNTSATATVAPGKETPPVSETSLTPVPQSTDVTPTPPPANHAGTPAAEPPDADEFIAKFQGQPVEFHACAYNPATALVNCAGFGIFGVNPPITGQDITCTLWEIDGKPVAIQCQSAEPLATRYYEIK